MAARTSDHRLSNWQQFRSEGIMLAGDPIKLQPAERSPYEFAEDAVPEERVPALAEAEQQEFRGDRELAACDTLNGIR